MATSSVLLCACLCAGTVFGREVKEIKKTVPLDADGRVIIDTYKGSIHVTGWDSAAVEIDARIEPDGSWASDERAARETEVSIDASPMSVRIKSDYRNARRHGWFHVFNSLPFVHYRIKMPRTARLEVKDYKSEIDIANLRSELHLDTYKGTGKVSDLDGSLRLSTYKGDLKVRFARLSAASLAETYKGEIEIALPRDAAFHLDSRVGRHGDLRSDFEKALRVNGGPTLTLKTHRGNFRLRKI